MELSFANVAHSYLGKPDPSVDSDWALKHVTHRWKDGGAHALLGPSGCGKSTILNLFSGLLKPTRGRILLDGRDVTGLGARERNIAQVFQFPVVYDTMSVRGNLAFPLRNRRISENEIGKRVNEVAADLGLSADLQRRAGNLSPDVKQKISLGRALVRTDVAAVLFDEPLTVVDPLIKWQLRSILKQMHRRFGRTMVYVTHDQTEALTFAERVLVMNNGLVVQEGTPAGLFERPNHRFVGHFIGSPGMNFMPCSVTNGRAVLCGREIVLGSPAADPPSGVAVELGVRPEHVHLGREGLPAQVVRIADLGRRTIADLKLANGARLKAVVRDGQEIPSETRVSFGQQNSFVYVDGWLAEKPRGSTA